NTIIAAGRADMCALARGSIEDAYFPRHAARALNYGGMKWPSQYRRAAEVQLRGERVTSRVADSVSLLPLPAGARGGRKGLGSVARVGPLPRRGWRRPIPCGER